MAYKYQICNFFNTKSLVAYLAMEYYVNSTLYRNYIKQSRVCSIVAKRKSQKEWGKKEKVERTK